MADQDVLKALLKNSGEQTVEKAIAKGRKEVDRFDNIVLNIAVAGESGTGKSSFVNAIRGVKDTEEGAARTGVTQTTTKPTPYPHPTMPNVIFYDLPGTGEPRFKAKHFLKAVDFHTYDFFIIVSATRFRENDIMLAKEIKKGKKDFYFVRSKIDNDVEEEKKKIVTETTQEDCEKKTLQAKQEDCEKKTLQVIRKDCEKNLKELTSLPVFLITSKDLDRFDFPKLTEALEEGLPEHKRQALVLSLPVYSQKSLEKKYNTFKKRVWALAISSGAVGGIPVPGLSTAFDIGIVVAFLASCYYSFGLDDKSLERLSNRVPEYKKIIQEVKESEMVIAVIGKSRLPSEMLKKLGIAGGVETLCNFVPIAGNIAAAGISFITTHSVLQDGLNEFYKIAQEVIRKAKLE